MCVDVVDIFLSSGSRHHNDEQFVKQQSLTQHVSWMLSLFQALLNCQLFYYVFVFYWSMLLIITFLCCYVQIRMSAVMVMYHTLMSAVMVTYLTEIYYVYWFVITLLIVVYRQVSSIIVVVMMRTIFKWWHYNGDKDGCDGGGGKIFLLMEYRWHLLTQFCISAPASQIIVSYAQRVWFPPSTTHYLRAILQEIYIDSYHTNNQRSFERVLPREGETFLHFYNPMGLKIILIKV